MDLGKRDPQDLKTCIARRKIGECSINETTRNFLLKPTDLDLNRNATKYQDNHIQKDAAEIILHFINGKY